jgi:membrane-associated protease RseP (regulator of RpoE activity)
MRRTIVPIIACLMAGSIVSAQTATTETDTQIGQRPHGVPEVRAFWQMQGLPCSTGGFLGVYPAEVTDEIASKYNMADPHGALLTKIEENTAASRAGLQVDDIIVGWNGARVESGVMLRRMINETPVGRKVKIEYLRNGVPGTIEATLDKRPAMDVTMPNIEFKEFKEFEEFKMPEGMPEDLQKNLEKMMENMPKLGRMHMVVGDGRMGATLQNMTPQLARYFGVDEGVGALVGSVREGSAAEKGGLQVGDVIVAIDGEKVVDPGDVARAISRKDNGEVEVRIMRDKAEQTLRVKLEGPAMNQEFDITVPPPAMDQAPSIPNGEAPDLGSFLAPRSRQSFGMKVLPNDEDGRIVRRTSIRGGVDI